MAYRPNPIDTSSIVLSEDVLELTEKLAENAHDEWALQRLSEGWTYGPERNDALKHHPGLVPYADLTEGEREYDRITAMKTLKALQALGYTIALKK
ncbi:RyR domain-containing protein [Cohnella faecalis]|uniref:Ryanodine receptor Ryr n=1 Tax=Cohnella faecalis TaxID=2315694 RepID=A0A398CNZ5_9BACL|nr:RyR domain-containing protein [Cohnella faecalis]RIE03009.1 Ryanodine receptor Ryr [Cohnella faecalis]